MAVGAWLVAVVLLAVSLVPGMAPRLAGLLPDDGGFPQRIGFIRGAPMLPDKPGPLAVVIDDNNFGNGGQEAVGRDGREWTLPTTQAPALSPDGSRVALLVRRTVEIRDLTEGTSTSWPAPGNDRVSTGSIHSLLAFMPDQTHLLVWMWGRTHGWTALLDVATGVLVRAEVNARPVGVTADGEIVALRAREDTLTVVMLDSRLAEVRRFTLAPVSGWTSDPRDVGMIAPDGGLVVPDGDRGALVLRRFSLDDGTETTDLNTTVSGRSFSGSNCRLTWRGDDPVVITKSYGSQAKAVQIHPDGSTTQLLAIHHRMQSNCVTFAADALEAGPHWSFLGANDAVWTWYWRPLLLILLVAGGVVWWVVSRRRRGRSRP